MKQPIFIYEGIECKVHSVSWDHGGEIISLTFYDQNGGFHTAFQLSGWDKPGYDDGLLHLELKDHLKA